MKTDSKGVMMEITLIIVAGVVLSVFFGSLFDFMSKRSKKKNKTLEAEIKIIKQKVSELEDKIIEKDERLNHLENDISFVNKLIEENTKNKD